ncbi:MAG TPA: formyltransferase family protein, partial [Acidimicrobiales bacterium]|nr:formyltransferase family protein [Acidimicrobiales bacterium]
MATAVLVSGEGTILEAIAATIPLDVVVADRPCRALEVARRADVEAVLVDRAAYGGFTAAFDRAGYTSALTEALDARAIDLVCMAGFGTILSPAFFDRFDGRVLNTHPSMLPAFRGWHPVRDALAAHATTTGWTVHV